MAREYSPKPGHLVDPECCKAGVPTEGRWPGFRQCKRKSRQDGWCNQHHPDTEAERVEENRQRWERSYRQVPAGRLADLEERYKALLAQRDELAGENDLLKQALGAVAPHALKMIVAEFGNGGD